MHKTPPIKRNAVLEAFRQDDYRKYRAILENSPGTGLIGGAYRNRSAASKRATLHSPWNVSRFNNRTSLFQSTVPSPAISRTTYNFQATKDNRERISNQRSTNIPGKILVPSDSIAGPGIPQALTLEIPNHDNDCFQGSRIFSKT